MTKAMQINVKGLGDGKGTVCGTTAGGKKGPEAVGRCPVLLTRRMW